MNPRERGFLLLTSHLGNPGRRVLTGPQLRSLAQRLAAAGPFPGERELEERDLVALGYGREMAGRILTLLAEEEVLDHYLSRAARQGCVPITRVSDRYPATLRRRLGPDAPGCLWARGDVSALDAQAVALVGSRNLQPENREFAEAVGYFAARNGVVLISGNARGADRTAQDACLAAGGRVISIVADELRTQPSREGMLYLSEEDFDAPFSASRALSRNRCIHALGLMVFVAQSGQNRGGTWSGTVQNLRRRWTPVLCFQDGSAAVRELENLGAYAIGRQDLEQALDIPQTQISFDL